MSVTASRDHDAPNVPRGALIGAAALLGFALCAAGAARLWHWHAATPAPVTALQRLQVRFLDRPDGAVEVRDAGHADQLLRIIAPGTNGFLRGVMRGFARRRHSEHVSAARPFTLTHWADGELTLADPATGERVSLEVFGSDNARVFATLFTAGVPDRHRGTSP